MYKSWNTKVVVNTRKGWETSEPIRFNKGLPQGDALCPRLFSVCLNPVSWKISATKGYRLSKPINVKVTDLLYIDDLKIFAASENKLSRIMKMVKAAMGDAGLECNPKKCVVLHVRRGMQVSDDAGVRLDEAARIPSLEDGKQYKFLGVLESVMQEDKLVLECATKEYLRRTSIIWTSPLSDHNRVIASNQFALPVLGYLMWTQQCPITELQQIEGSSKECCGERRKASLRSNALLYLPRSKGAEAYLRLR